MAEPKDTSPEKQAGGVAVKWILIIIAFLWLITHKTTVKELWEKATSPGAKARTEMVDLKVGEVSREVLTDPAKEWLDFDITDTNLSWYIIPNGNMEDKIPMGPGNPINNIGRGYYKLQFMLGENVNVNSHVIVQHIPH